jgi:hypothetical protein
VTEPMLTLGRSAAAWNSPAFQTTLVEELRALGAHYPALCPPLQAGLTQTSALAEAPLGIQVLSSSTAAGRIRLRLGVFYAGVIAGCSCADHPTSVDTINEHCELLLDLDPATGQARVSRCDD